MQPTIANRVISYKINFHQISRRFVSASCEKVALLGLSTCWVSNILGLRKRKSHDIKLLINDYKLDQVRETIFLGVILDENLNWKS